MNPGYLPSLLWLCLCMPAIAFGQSVPQLNPCGAREGKVDWLVEYQQNPQPYPRSNDTLYIPLSIHLVGNDNGGGYFSVKSVLAALCTLNEDFRASAIQFYVEGDYHYIPNSVYNDHNFNQGREMMSIYKVPNTINCYIVSSPAGNCGYSSYNLGIALAKNCTGVNDHTWAHEIGHFLSLPHPFNGWEGYEHNYNNNAPVQIGDDLVERLDGFNCQIAGDGFCDTAPDYLNYRWPCNEETGESLLQQKDPNGESFRSDGRLFMSYSFDNCTGRFSEEQIAAMRANLYSEKEDMIHLSYPAGLVTDEAVAGLSPEEGSLVEYYDHVTFSWTAVPNANRYILEVSPFPNMALILVNEVVSDTSITIAELDDDRTYYWRIRPFNEASHCTGFSDIFSFTTGFLTDIPGIKALHHIELAPNPGKAGSAFQLQVISEESLDLMIRLISASGITVQQQRWMVGPGYNQLEMSTGNLASGFYMVHLKSHQGMAAKKLILGR